MHSLLDAAQVSPTALLSSNSTEGVVNAVGQHFVPSTAAGVVFALLFAASTILHIFFAIRYRKFFMIPTVIFGGLLETLGWGGRVWMSKNPMSFGAFIMQSTTLVLGPTPLVAANFVITGRIIDTLGPQYSRLSPRLYAIIFCSCDVLTLLTQGSGGGISAKADNSASQASLGTNITLAGTIFQLVVIIVYSALKAEFLYRHSRGLPIRPATVRENPMTQPIKTLTAAVIFNTACLVIRSIYRIVEFADGWNGKIANTEAYFIAFDGVMVVLAIYALVVAHPGRLLPSQKLKGLESRLELSHLNNTNNTPRVYQPVHSEDQMY